MCSGVPQPEENSGLYALQRWEGASASEKVQKFHLVNTALSRTFRENLGKESLLKFKAGDTGAFHSKDMFQVQNVLLEAHRNSLLNQKSDTPPW